MSGDPLARLAAVAGVVSEWVDASGRRRRLQAGSLRRLLATLGYGCDSPAQCRDSLARAVRDARRSVPLRTVDAGRRACVGEPDAAYQLQGGHGTADGRLDARGCLPAIREPGYYRLRLGSGETTLAVAPARCFGVADALGSRAPRAWGVAVQVYAMRSRLDGGIGDAAGAHDWAGRVAAEGGDALVLGPLHAGGATAADPSPYSPSDRCFLNLLHAAPQLVLGEEAVTRALLEGGFEAGFAAARQCALVDWPASAAAKLQWLRRLHADFERGGLVLQGPALQGALLQGTALQDQFDRFCSEGGTELRRHASFCAARDDAMAHGEGEDWRAWPRQRQLQAGHVDDASARQRFHLFAQWLAAASWSRVQARARQSGMRLGLLADIAVGFSPDGGEAWRHRDALLQGATIGAPPDAFDARGQDWGVAAFSPQALRASGYAAYIALLRACMRDRGGVRIDHVPGLMRLWVVPNGQGADAGGYLRYPMQDLLRLLALESWRHRAIVIGEDLGTVSQGLRSGLADRGVLGIDVLMFARDRQGGLLPPARWRADAVATTTTHDLPTAAGWRRGRDLHWRHRLGLIDTQALRSQRRQRAGELRCLGRHLVGRGHYRNADVLAFVARSPSPLLVAPVEDLLELDEQPNIPGTLEGHPNWRRRLPQPLPEPTLARNFAALRRARPRCVP